VPNRADALLDPERARNGAISSVFVKRLMGLEGRVSELL
jgi:hypothetical protein